MRPQLFESTNDAGSRTITPMVNWIKPSEKQNNNNSHVHGDSCGMEMQCGSPTNAREGASASEKLSAPKTSSSIEEDGLFKVFFAYIKTILVIGDAEDWMDLVFDVPDSRPKSPPTATHATVHPHPEAHQISFWTSIMVALKSVFERLFRFKTVGRGLSSGVQVDVLDQGQSVSHTVSGVNVKTMVSTVEKEHHNCLIKSESNKEEEESESSNSIDSRNIRNYQPPSTDTVSNSNEDSVNMQYPPPINSMAPRDNAMEKETLSNVVTEAEVVSSTFNSKPTSAQGWKPNGTGKGKESVCRAQRITSTNTSVRLRPYTRNGIYVQQPRSMGLPPVKIPEVPGVRVISSRGESFCTSDKFSTRPRSVYSRPQSQATINSTVPNPNRSHRQDVTSSVKSVGGRNDVSGDGEGELMGNQI